MKAQIRQSLMAFAVEHIHAGGPFSDGVQRRPVRGHDPAAGGARGAAAVEAPGAGDAAAAAGRGQLSGSCLAQRCRYPLRLLMHRIPACVPAAPGLHLPKKEIFDSTKIPTHNLQAVCMQAPPASYALIASSSSQLGHSELPADAS